MEQQDQGPQNTIQFLTMMITSLIKGIPQMIKSMIVTSVISGAFTLGLHFYLILVPNDGYNSSGNPILDSILVLANVNPTPPNVLLFWFLANYLFWWVIGTFKEHGLVGGVKQFVTTPIFAVNSLRESGFGAFPMLMGGLGFAFLLRLGILGTMTTLQMFLMMIGILVSQENSITLIGMDLFFTDVRKLVNRGQEIESSGFGMPTSLILGSVVGFAYLVFFPYNVLMVQVLLVLMVLGIVGMFVQGRKKGKADHVALALMLLCALSLMAMPVNADDGGAAESGGAMNVINNVPLRDYMIRQGINPALAGIAASLFAQGKLTKGIFDQLKKGKLDPSKAKSIQEMQTLQDVRTKILHNLQHMDHEVWFGKANKLWKEKGSPGDIRKHIDAMVDDIIYGREVDLNKYGKIHTVYTGHITGRTITEDMIPTDAQLNREIFTNTVAWSTRELVTGRDVDGNMSWAGLIGRIGTGIGTGGASEFVWAPANALYTMKDYVDAGETSTVKIFLKTAAWTFVEEMVIGNGIQYGMGKLGGVAGKFGRYLDDTFPDAGRAIRSGFNKVDDVLHKDVGDFFRNKPGLPRGSQYTSADDIVKNINRIETSGQKVPGMDDFQIGQKLPGDDIATDFSKMNPMEGKPPLTDYDLKGFQDAAELNDAVIVLRKGNEASLDVIASKQAHPKSMDIKAKSIKPIDAELGYNDVPAIQGRAHNEGLVACKKPKIPDDFSSRPPGKQREILDRYYERLDEYKRLSPELEQMQKAGKIDWDPETGIIRNAKDGRPYAGDNDPFVYLDPDTGAPLNQYRNNTVNQHLQQNGHTLHNEHTGWQYQNTQGTPNYNTYQNIDTNIMTGHQNGGLVAYNPRTKQWYEVAMGTSNVNDNGQVVRNWVTWTNATGGN